MNSDLVCTFFHPLLRDQQDADIHVKKVKEVKQLPSVDLCGEIKFSFQYHRDTLTVMVSFLILHFSSRFSIFSFDFRTDSSC